MTDHEFCDLAAQLMRCPAAPYHEAAVRAQAELICAREGLFAEPDAFGNLLVRLETPPSTRPLVLAAHLDHPGFEIFHRVSRDRYRARFLGGVGDDYFRPGIPLRLMPGAAPAVLGKRAGKEKEFEIQALGVTRFKKSRLPLKRSPSSSDSHPTFCVWELEDFAVRRGRIHGRACDDLIGAVSILATMIELKRTRARVNVLGVLSRAEEIGFRGALTVATGKHLPGNSLVISLETSREIPPVKMGQGVILRVGDRTSIFDSKATRFLSEVAQQLTAEDKEFRFQRALMSGGTCEGTAYQEFGFQTGAVCVALGNYHNCADRNRIAAEFVSISDACGMVRLLVKAAREMPRYEKLVSRLPKRLNALLKEGRKRLREPV